MINLRTLALQIMVFFTSVNLSLGSWYGLMLGTAQIYTMAWRVIMEERMLLEELTGYTEYMEKVKRRFIPYIL